MPALKSWHIAAVITILLFAFFHNILLGRAFLWEDFLYLGYPQRIFEATALMSGHFPLWNPYTFDGMPYLADLSNSALYLGSIIVAPFAGLGTWGFFYLIELVAMLHYPLAAFSMYLLVRSFDVRRPAALFAGIAYMLTGPMITQAIHVTVIANTAWLPLILFLFRKALASRGWMWVFVTALVLGHSILIGFPQLSLFIYALLFLFFLLEISTTFKGRLLLSGPALRMALRAAALVALSVALAAIQLMPSLELAGFATRSQMTYEKATEGSLAWSQILTLFSPKLFGTSGAGGYNYWGPGAYWCFWETCIYIGALPLVLAALSFILLRKNRYVAFFWGTALLAIAYSLGNGFFLHHILYDIVPGISNFRVPGRAGILFTFSATVLSAFALDNIFSDRTEQSTRRLRRILIGTAAAAVLLWALIVSGSLNGSFSFLTNPAVAREVTSTTHVSLLLMLLSCGVLYAIMARRLRGRAAVGALLVLFFVDMYSFGGGLNDGRTNPADYFSRADRLVNFIRTEGEHEYFRVNTRNAQGMVMDRNQGMVDQIFTMEGYTPLALQRLFPPMPGDKLLDILNVKYVTVTDERTHSLAFVPHTTYLPRAFLVYRLRVVHSEPDLMAALKDSTFNHRTAAILEKDPPAALPVPADTPQGSAQITAYDINHIALEVRTAEPAFLVLSEAYYPGWKATVDGQETEIFRADYSLRGIFMPAGDHVVQFVFSPDSFARGSLISGAALVLCLAGYFLSRRRERAGVPANKESRETPPA